VLAAQAAEPVLVVELAEVVEVVDGGHGRVTPRRSVAAVGFPVGDGFATLVDAATAGRPFFLPRQVAQVGPERETQGQLEGAAY
jgi:hypothetical protein